MDNDMNQSHTDESNSGFLGEYLKSKRIEKNYSLEKLSQKTKISVNILKSLEANDYSHLPSAAYIKGFVANYVKVLGVPKEEAISKMEYTYLTVMGKPFPALNHTKNMARTSDVSSGSKPRPTAQPSPHDVIESGDSILENTKSILPIIIFGLIVVLFVGGYKLISSVVQDEVSTNAKKDLGPKIESSAALVKDEDKVEQPKTEASSTEEVTEADSKEVKPEVETPKEVIVEPEITRNFPTVNFYKIRNKLFTVRNDAPENDDETLIPQSIKDAFNSDLQNVYIKAVDGNTWLSYKIDNKPIESVIIKQGNDLFLQGSDIRVFLGNVNVTKIFYNNYLIDTPTKSGVKSLIFPEESNEKYQLPLFPKANDDILYTSEEYQKRMKLEEEELAKKKKD